MTIASFFASDTGKSITAAGTSFFTDAAIKAAQRAGVNLGDSSPQARAAAPIQGTPTQPQQAVLSVSPWYKKPLAVIGIGVGLVVLVWVLLRGKG
jgi:hypothetical protein